MTDYSADSSGCQRVSANIFVSPLARIALYASIAATLVSIGLNVTAAWDMRADIGTMRAIMLALGSASLGAMAPLAFLAAARSTGKARTQSLIAGCVLLAFNLSTAIGTAEHGRTSLVAVHNEASNNSAEWTRLRDEKAAANAKLQNSRSALELQPIIDNLKMTPGANNCVKIDGAISTKVCKQVSDLDAEIARGELRATLQTEIAELNTKLAKPVASAADPRAAAVSWLFSLAGINIAENDTGRALSVLLAAALEIASSFGVTIAFALDVAAPMRRTQPQQRDAPRIVVSDEPAPAHAGPAAPAVRIFSTRASEVDAAVIDYIRRSGRVRETQRVTAEKLGLPKSSVGASLLRLRDRGAVVVRDGAIELVPLRAVA
jgi:hypothetical protein